MYKRYILFLTCLIPGLIRAQLVSEGNNFFTREYTGMFQVYGKGIGTDMKLGWYTSATTVNFIHAELITLRNAKEVKVINANLQQDARTYVYNKINHAYPLHLGYGIKKYLAPKLYRNSTSVAICASGGLALTALKPIYLNTITINPDFPNGLINTVRVSEETYPHQSIILGNAGFGYGFDELTVTTGLYGKLGLNMEWSDYFDEITAIEVGVIVDAFTKPLPLLRQFNNQQIYSNFYIALVFGSKK